MALIFNGPIIALVVVNVLVGANPLEHHVLQPLLMGKVLRIHGLAILLALAAGTTLAGLVGAVLAVPLTAVGWSIIKIWTGPDGTCLRHRHPTCLRPLSRLRTQPNSGLTLRGRNVLTGGWKHSTSG